MLLVRINAKIGGINSSIDSEVVRFLNRTMIVGKLFTRSQKGVCSTKVIVGADVSHPGPGVRSRPSIASLVATHSTTAIRTPKPKRAAFLPAPSG